MMNDAEKSIKLIDWSIDFFHFLPHVAKGIAVIVPIIPAMDTVMVVVVVGAFARAAIVVDHRPGVAIDSVAAKINQANACVASDGMNSS